MIIFENIITEQMLVDLITGPFKGKKFQFHHTDPATGQRKVMKLGGGSILKKILIYALLAGGGAFVPFLGPMLVYIILGMLVLDVVWHFIGRHKWRFPVVAMAMLIYFFPITNFLIHYVFLTASCALNLESKIYKDVKLDGYYRAKDVNKYRGCDQFCVQLLIEGNFDFFEIYVSNPSLQHLTNRVGNYRFYRADIEDPNCTMYWKVKKYFKKERPRNVVRDDFFPKYQELGQYQKYCVASLRVSNLKSEFEIISERHAFILDNYETVIRNRSSMEVAYRSTRYSYKGSNFIRALMMLDQPADVITCDDVKWLIGTRLDKRGISEFLFSLNKFHSKQL